MNPFHSLSKSADIFIALSGSIEVTEKDQQNIIINKGECFIAFTDAQFIIKANQDSIIYSAGVPLKD